MEEYPTKEKTLKIGFIGLGVMGAPMAGHLIKAGHELFVYTRTPQKAQPLLEQGAVWCDSASAVAEKVEVVCTMLGFPEDVREVYLGEDGLLESVRDGALLIDFTTSSPSLAREIAKGAAERGASAVDAPVSGGDVGARNAALSIMVGAEPEDFGRAKPFLETLGSNVVLQGPPGSGQTAKLCNQTAIASTMLGVCEAIALARRGGLDPETVLKSIQGGAAGSWTLSNLAPRMLKDDPAPGFYVKHFIKDMRLALETAEAEGLDLPGLRLTLERYRRLEAEGGGDLGTQALIRGYL